MQSFNKMFILKEKKRKTQLWDKHCQGNKSYSIHYKLALCLILKHRHGLTFYILNHDRFYSFKSNSVFSYGCKHLEPANAQEVTN